MSCPDCANDSKDPVLVFSRSALSTAEPAVVSKVIATGSSNAVSVDFVVFVQSATKVSFTLEGSSDRENWASIYFTLDVEQIGFVRPLLIPAITSRYIRVKAVLVGGGVAVVSSSAALSEQ